MTARLFASFSPDPDRPMVQIYGNTEGLNSLASKLIEFAEYQQNHAGHDPGDHWHFFPGKHGLIRESFEITISRMDDRKSHDTTWCEALLADSQLELRNNLSIWISQPDIDDPV